MAKFSLKTARRSASDNDPTTALVHYMGIIKALPNKASSLRQEFLSALGGHLHQLAHSESSEADVAQVIALSLELYPDCGDVFNVYGEWLFANGHVSKAAECFLQALGAADASIGAKRNLANLSTHLVDQWHFRMLNDRTRNEAYASAIQHFVKMQRNAKNDACKVLDIGAGTGLLSVMAAQAGASAPVFACEQDQLMCAVSRRVIADNNLQESIVVLPRNSQAVTVADLNGKVDLIVTELMDAGFFGEGIISALLDAKRRLLTETGVIIPNKAEILAAVIECSAISEDHVCLPETSGAHKAFVSKFCLEGSDEPYTSDFLDELKGDFRLLTEPVVVCSIDLNSEEDLLRVKNGFSSTICLNIRTSGCAHSVIAWFRAYLTADVVLETMPKSGTCWEQAIFPLSLPFNVAVNDSIALAVTVRDNWFRCSFQSPLNDLDVQQVTGCSTIALMNDGALAATLERWLQSAISVRPIAQVLDCARCPSVTRVLARTLPDAFVVSLVEDAPAGVEALSADLFGDSTKVLVCTTMESVPSAAFDVVVCLPIAHNGLLSGGALQQVAFSRVKFRIDRVVPCKVIVRAALIESEQLLSRSTVLSSASTCGVQVRSAFGPFGAHLQQDIELATLRHRRLSADFDVMTLNLEETLNADSDCLPQFLRQETKINVTVTAEGCVHGVLLWFDLYEGDQVLNTADERNCFKLCAHLFAKPDCVVVNRQVVSLHCTLLNGDLSFYLSSDF